MKITSTPARAVALWGAFNFALVITLIGFRCHGGRGRRTLSVAAVRR